MGVRLNDITIPQAVSGLIWFRAYDQEMGLWPSKTSELEFNYSLNRYAVSFSSGPSPHWIFRDTADKGTFLTGSLNRSSIYLISCLFWQLMYTSNLWGWLQLQLGIPAGGKLNTVLHHRDKTGPGTLGIIAPEGRAEYKKRKQRWKTVRIPGQEIFYCLISGSFCSVTMGKGQ